LESHGFARRCETARANPAIARQTKPKARWAHDATRSWTRPAPAYQNKGSLSTFDTDSSGPGQTWRRRAQLTKGPLGTAIITTDGVTLDIVDHRTPNQRLAEQESKKMELMKVSLLVFDFDLYPRQRINTIHVRALMDAEEGGAEIPPILIDTKSKRIADGFHRATAKRRLYGDDAEIMVVKKRYRNEQDLLLDAIRLNADHGLHMDPCDRARAIILAVNLNIDADAVASALHVSVDKVNELKVNKTARTDGITVAIKNTIKHKRGQKLTRKQVEANTKLGGMNQAFYANQLITLIEANLLDTNDDRLMTRLQILHDLLDGVLAVK
jgi:hypothetical protein